MHKKDVETSEKGSESPISVCIILLQPFMSVQILMAFDPIVGMVIEVWLLWYFLVYHIIRSSEI